MTNKVLLALSTAVATLCATAVFAETAPTKLADVEIKIDDLSLVQKGEGINTLYISLYDADSPMPRPYAAIKIALDKGAAKGTIYRGSLNTGNVTVMGGAQPKAFRVKAKLDKDGAAGPDAAGDLVGIIEKVVVGAATVVTIDKAM